jgi:nitrous oxidase accessory protein
MPRLAALLAVLLLACAPAWAQQTITVRPGTSARPIAEALDRARPGDRLLVAAGTYRESNLVVTKSVDLIAQGEAILDGGGEPILRIEADGVTVRGFTFRNVAPSFVEDRAAILVEKAADCVIDGNAFEDTFFGVYLAETSGCAVTGNTLRGRDVGESKAGNGIHLWYSRHVTVTGNTIVGHRDGIYFEFVEDGVVEDNVSEGNLRYGLHFMFSDRCRYARNAFLANGAGVAVMYTKHVEMVENRFEDNWGPAAFGLLLKDITDSTINRNVFARNTVGLYAEGSNRVEIAENAFERNGWAVKVMADAYENMFTRNNFVANSFDVGTNSRQSYSTFAGNYWDGYEGYDLDRDGVGDVPFRPVRLFALLVERNEPALLLMRSLFVQLLDVAERVAPVLTPATLVDERPAMRPLAL